MAASILWYDLETFGRSPAGDRIAQFAGIRTTEDLTPIGESFVLYAKVSPDYLPDPYSCLITGITPQDANDRGICEAEFIKKILGEFLQPATCMAGYNTIHFDDEFIRHALYRNLYDPYQREYVGGNSRWDLTDVARVAHDLRPENMIWPKKDDGRPDFRLTSLTEANNIGHEHAHDALADVYATIGLARKIRDTQPRLFSYLYSIRRKDEIQRLKLLNVEQNTPVVYTSAMFTSPHGCSRIVAPVAVDPANGNVILAVDLSRDVDPLFDESVDELRRRFFTPRDELAADEPPPPIVSIAINRCPAVSPISTLDAAAQKRLGINERDAYRRLDRIVSHPGILQKVAKIFERNDFQEIADVDFQLYSGGFFHNDDLSFFERVHQTRPQDLPTLQPGGRDPRIPELLRRYVARNYPQVLSAGAQGQWRKSCATRITSKPAPGVYDQAKFRNAIHQLWESSTTTTKERATLARLREYEQWLSKELLDIEPAGER